MRNTAVIVELVSQSASSLNLEKNHSYAKADQLCQCSINTLDTMVRPLSTILQKIAIEELREDPERVEEDIKHMQEWIKQQPHLNAPTDEQWILTFLRGCKFSLQGTKKKFETYYTLRNVMPELLKSRDFCSPEIQAILNAGMILPLPYTENHQGPRIILVRYHNLDTRIMNAESLTALLYMILNILMDEDDNLVISGVILWFDLSRLPLSFLFQFTPAYLKNLFNSLKNAFPLRIKGLHGSGSFVIAEKILTLMKGYFGQKLKKRAFIYSEDNFEELLKVIPKDYMPKEYEGPNSNIEEIKDYWVNKVESYSKWLMKSNQYHTNEAMRLENLESIDDVIGIDGSFRKLNID